MSLDDGDYVMQGGGQGGGDPEPEPQPRPNPNSFKVMDGKIVEVTYTEY